MFSKFNKNPRGYLAPIFGYGAYKNANYSAKFRNLRKTKIITSNFINFPGNLWNHSVKIRKITLSGHGSEFFGIFSISWWYWVLFSGWKNQEENQATHEVNIDTQSQHL